MTPPARRQSLPAWFGKGWRRDAAGSRRPWHWPRPALRRHARPALLSLLAAAGVASAQPGDAGLLFNTQGSDRGAVPTASPAAIAAVALPPAPVGVETAAPAPVREATAGPTLAAEVTAAPTSVVEVTAAPTSVAATAAPTSVVATMAAVGSIAAPDVAPPVAGGLGKGQPASGSSAVLSATLQIVNLPANPARRRAQTWEPPEPPADLTGYVWPLPHGRITDSFGPSPWGTRVVNGRPFHDGLDIATFCGDRILAAHNGLVLAAGRRFDEKIGWVGDLGPYFARLDAKQAWWTLPITVVIDDGNGYRSIYAHFSQVVVKVGQRVRAGQFIGYEGATGRATGCHLHYGLFSPHETATFAIEPALATRMLVPAFQIARVDPLLVLPARRESTAAPGPAPPGLDATGPDGVGE